MIFEPLYDSFKRNELILLDNGMCHFHLRNNGQVTIREIIAKKGAGSRILRRLEHTIGASSLFAKCPIELAANQWYAKKGFVLESTETTKTGRILNCWRKPLSKERQPNVGDLEIIYCAGGNPRFAEIAIDAGMLYGARLPHTLRYQPYFVDQDWKKPDRAKYMTLLAKYRPYMATVLDWETPDQETEVMEWVTEAAQWVKVVVIIPKVSGTLDRIPDTVNTAKVRLGYSVPTRYGGTKVPLEEFKDREVHLLGGAPQKQMALAQHLRVRSVDTNYMQKLALMVASFWVPHKIPHATSPRWPTLKESGMYVERDGPYLAFEISCRNIMRAWQTLDTQA